MTSITNFGALTTTFPVPTDCAVGKWIEHNTKSTSLLWGAGCETGTVGYASSCYPSGWSGSSNNTALSYKGFSPGLACPQGWTATATVSDFHRGQGWSPLNAYITDLADDEIATICCPSDYVFNKVCYSQASQITESRPLITTSDGKCYTTTVPPFFGRIGGTTASKGFASIHAYPVILVNTRDSSTGLSTGAKIAIGICVPAAVLIVAVICFIWWHHRRAQATRASQSLSPAPAEPHGKPELDAGHEIQPGVPGAPAELPALQTDTPQAELPAFKSPGTPQAELAGDFEQIVSVKEKKEEDVSGDGGDTREAKASDENREINQNDQETDRGGKLPIHGGPSQS